MNGRKQYNRIEPYCGGYRLKTEKESHMRTIGKRLGRRILSMVLIAAMVLGLIPQSAYAAETTGVAVLAGEGADGEVSGETTDNSDVEDTNNLTGTEETIISEKWKGLDYALFTSGDEDISLYTASTRISGSVHSNKNFCYQGSVLRIDGVLEAAERIMLKTSDGRDALQVTSKLENAPKYGMPDITDEIGSYTAEHGIVYEGNKDFNNDNLVIDTPVGISGNAIFNATSFLGTGIVYAEESVVFNVGELATPEDSRVLIMSKNGNITLNGSDMALNAILYAPNGCVTINTARLNLNGRIIAKKVNINGSDININAGPDDYEMLDFLLKPEFDIHVEGNQKVNRKVTLSIDDLSETAQTVMKDAVWSITRAGEEVSDCYVFDADNSNVFHKEMLFLEPGTYSITAVVQTETAECTVTKELVIAEDMAPTAGFVLESDTYSRNEEGKAVVHIADASYSPDGDSIGQRIWTIYYDENNDGIYEEVEGTVVSAENEAEIDYEATGVGCYKVVLQVVETFEDTISKLLEEGEYLKDDTLDIDEKSCVFEVGNEAPLASINIEKSKAVDIVFTAGDVDRETLNIYTEGAEALRKQLVEEGVDANIDTVSTSMLTAQDTFAWTEYDHYNYIDRYLPTLEKHILYEEDSIRMVGYSQKAMKDFLYVADDNSGKKTFEFDLQRDRNNWHSMEGGGFLFNTTVDEEANTIKGFCILVTQSGLKLVKIDYKDLNRFRNAACQLVQNAGALLKTYKMKNLYDKHHLKIEVDSKTISVWDGDTLLIDNFVLPENDYGYGFGPIISHVNHGCNQQSYFTFENITMTTMIGSSLSDIVKGYDWRPGAAHYVVNLSNAKVPELSTDEETADLAAALIKNDAAFIGMGNEINENQYVSLLNAAQTGGMYLSAGEIADTMSGVSEYIKNSVFARDYGIGKYITTDDIVTYGMYYQDAEGDDIYEQQWEYEYDPTVFGESQDETEHIVREGSEPITTFEQTGAYTIRLKVRDNPVGENDALDAYRKWSDTEEYEKLLVVQTRPIAEVSVGVSENPSDKSQCIANVTYTAQDPDHPNDGKQGIREEIFWYKNVTDGTWTEGKLPNKLIVGETYLVKYQVKDIEGTWSFPAAAVVKTSDLLAYEEIVDETAPEVFIDVTKEEISVGESIYIEGYAEDDNGVDTFELYVDDEQVLDAFGRVSFIGEKEGIVTVRAVATDIGGNTSEKEITIKVTDNRDKTVPFAEITSPLPGSEIGFDVQIVGTAKDETEFKRYTLSYKAENETQYHVFAESTTPVSNDVLGSLDISDFTDGSYEILLTVEDTAGNLSYYGILIYIETGVTKGYTLKGELTAVHLSEEKRQIDICGLASAQGHMKRYTLSYQFEGKGEPVLIAEGTEEVENAVLGSVSTDGLIGGTYNLLLVVEDTEGNTETVCGAFVYTEGETDIETDLTAPIAEITKVEITEDSANIDICATVKDDKELKGYTLAYSKEESGVYHELMSGTEPIEDTSVAVLPMEMLEDGNYILRLQAWDATGNSTTYIMTFTYKKASSTIEIGKIEDNDTPVNKDFAIALSHSVADIGTEVQVQVTLPADIKEETLKISMGETEIAVGTRKTSFTYDKAGRVEITAAGVTDAGEEKKVTASCTFYNLKDKNSPTVALTSPAIDQILTCPVDFVGSAYDEEELDFWKLEYRMKGDKEYLLLAEGTEAKRDEILAHFDTTMLLNGQYEVRLTAQDKGGNVRRLKNDYVVEGELKIGVMHIGFTDIVAQMGAATVSLNRMYDSRNKQQGDFGIGWNLGIQGMEIIESNDLTEGYELVQSGSLFSTGYQMMETVSHDVVVTYGDGTSDRFELTFTPERKALVPITEVELGYRCVTNQKVKLEIIEDTTAYVYANGLLFYDESIYDTRNYKLTTEDGSEIYLNSDKGVYQIVDASGNIIAVDKDGYHAENGRSIIFTRDEQDRIVKAEDPKGDVITYQYDGAGNLVAVTDSADRMVTFAYDKKHNLASIIDPMGIATARNEYDNAGRLIATIDADGNRVEYNYDVEGRTQTVKDRRGNTTVYTYDDNGNILQTIDAYGNTTKNTYDENNNLLSTTDAKGNRTGYAYDDAGNVTQVTAPDGTTVKSTYIQDNLVSSIQMLDKTVMAMEYDDNGRIASAEDANGNVTEYSYTTDGKLSGLTDKIGTYQKVTYDKEGNVATTTNGAGESASYTYDEKGRCTGVSVSREEKGKTLTLTSHYSYNEAGDITQSIDNAGNITTYEYDANGNRTASVDAKGRRIVYEYDDLGNLTKTNYPDGTFESFTYDANGNNITATDRNGLMVTMVYDKLDRMTEKEYADGTKEHYSYDEVGNVIEQVSTSGATTTYGYDDRYCNTSITDTFGNVTIYTYDEVARLTKRTDAKGNTIAYEYDDNGNLTKILYADGNSITSKYDARNRVIKQEDQYGNETKYEYDGADRLIKVTDAYGNSYSYGYDTNGNLITVTDANEHVTCYTYDAVGRVAMVQNALGKTMEYSYDETGNVTEFRDYAGITTAYTYDSMDRLIEKKVGVEKETGVDTTTYTYNDKSLLAKVTDESGDVTYAYDEYNRLSAVTDARGITVSYIYDKVGRLEKFDNGFGTTTYEYDVLDRVTRVIDRNGQATVYEYDELGNRSAVRYPNGNVVTYTYDACQRLKEEWIVDAEGTTLAKYTYGLGKAGERTSITEISGGVKTETTYKYDKLDRLVTENIERNGNSLTNTFEYDEVSNRISKETTVKGDVSVLADVDSEAVGVTEGKTTYTYNALNQLIAETSEDGVITYTYDNNGNLVKQTGNKTVDYSYDKENHLLRAVIQNGNSVTIEAYTYDYAGNRTSKTINEADIIYYVNDTSGSLTMVAAETDKYGNETAYYTRGAELLSMEREKEVWCYLYDGHGSTRFLTNKDGRITDTYSYDAYGNLFEKEGDTENEFLYTGEQYNANTELYYLRARYMNPGTGTLISMDSYQGSIHDPVTLHKYLYANANPVMYTDPSGYTSMAEAGAYMSCTTSLSVSQVYYNAMILAIGINIIAQLRAVAAVETVAHISSETVLSIGLEGALSGSSNITAISNELLFKSVDAVTLAYMIAGDCVALDLVSSTVEETKTWVETSAVALREENKKQYKGHCVYVLKDSKNGNKVSYVGRTKNPWKRYSEHRRDKRKQTDGEPWKMYIVKEGLSQEEAAALENALICIYTIDALANARHEIAVKRFDRFEKEFDRAASICRMPLTELKDIMKGDYR